MMYSYQYIAIIVKKPSFNCLGPVAIPIRVRYVQYDVYSVIWIYSIFGLKIQAICTGMMSETASHYYFTTILEYLIHLFWNILLLLNPCLKLYKSIAILRLAPAILVRELCANHWEDMQNERGLNSFQRAVRPWLQAPPSPFIFPLFSPQLPNYCSCS